MRTPRPSVDLEKFFERVRSSSSRLLMLDYDGTLAPFADHPSSAFPYPGVVPALDAIMEAGHTRVVIVSGRWTRDLLPVIRLAHRPELWGSHGWERVAITDQYDDAPVPSEARVLLAAAADWAKHVESLGGRVERKPASIAFHWRGLPLPQIGAIRDELLARWSTLAQSDRLAWHEFDGGIELRAAGRDKGHVVRLLAEEAGSDAAIAYLGDDLTDEDAFQAMPEHGLAVLVRPQERATAADIWITPPDELIDFLRRWDHAAAQQNSKERRDVE
jgi:trehalose-phosphatase